MVDRSSFWSIKVSRNERVLKKATVLFVRYTVYVVNCRPLVELGYAQDKILWGLDLETGVSELKALTREQSS